MSWELKGPAVQLKGTEFPGAALSAGPVRVMNGCPATKKGTCLHTEGGTPPALNSLSEAPVLSGPVDLLCTVCGSCPRGSYTQIITREQANI